jgi:acyl-CoA synthetase (AMP-forming)/AMP-acid ligase II
MRDLLNQVASQRKQGDFVILTDTSQTNLQMTELWKRAAGFAAFLKQEGIQPGDRIVALLPTSAEFLVCMIGTWLRGAIFAPFPTTLGSNRAQISSQDLRKRLERSRATLAIVEPKLLQQVAAVAKGSLTRVVVSTGLFEWEAPIVQADIAAGCTTAILNFTSGSTSDPKPIDIHHDQIAHNVVSTSRASGLSPDDCIVSWLPLFHDFGLYLAALPPLLIGCRSVLIPTPRFIRQPSSWFEAITEFGGTHSPTPPIGLELMLRFREKLRQKKLTLASWRYVWVAAEPVFPSLLDRFESEFANIGLSSTAVQPAYGMAEAVVGVAVGTPGIRRRTAYVDGRRLIETGEVRLTSTSQQQYKTFSACGSTIPDMQIEVRSQDGRERLGERRLGRIFIKAPCVSKRIWEGDEILDEGCWLDTGDSGFMLDGMIFPTGREKEVLMRGGLKFSPQDIESVAQAAIPANYIRGACFAVRSEAAEREAIVIAIETRAEYSAHAKIKLDVLKQVNAQLSLTLDEVLLLSPGSIPRTTSGKVQRIKSRKLYEAGTLNTSLNHDDSKASLEGTAACTSTF